MERTKQRGLSTAALKWIALGLMVLDHIHYFFGFTGWVPEAFSMAGRLSANLFLFCLVEGFAHTHDRRRYFLRVWAVAAGMGAVYAAFLFVPGLRRPDGFFPYNAVFANFAVLMPMLQGVDWLRQKRWGRGLAALCLPLAWPVAASLAAGVLPLGEAVRFGLTVLGLTVLPMWSLISDGGLFYILLGVLLYCLRGKRLWQAAAYTAYILLVWLVRPWLVLGCGVGEMFTTYYEWFSVCSVFLMLCYNGQKGRSTTGQKWFFYVFYPAHVYVFYAVSWWLYCFMQ